MTEALRRMIEVMGTSARSITASTVGVVPGIANRLRAHVNLIALNPTPLSDERPSTKLHIEEFAQKLQTRGVNVTVRDTRGREIDAACGQLRVRASSSESASDLKEAIQLAGPDA